MFILGGIETNSNALVGFLETFSDYAVFDQGLDLVTNINVNKFKIQKVGNQL